VNFSVNGQTSTLVDAVSYAPFGPVTGLTYGNGLTLTRSFDSAYRLTAQSTPGVLERTYPNYDANGNRLGQTDTSAGPSSFTYDPLDRLDTATGPFGSRNYDYDRNGNRLQQVADGLTTALTYEPNSNHLDTLAANDVQLDAIGDTLNNGAWSYTYNPYHRLRTATETATLKASFAYNGLGQRLTKTDTGNGTGRHFLYGTDGALLAETDAGGNVLLEYLYLNGRLLAVYSPDDDQDGLSNQQEAGQGTLPANTDSDGDGLTNLVEWFQYGTDSANPDSDGDGVFDGAEVTAGTSPLDAGTFPGDGDITADGATNAGDLVLLYQVVLGTRTPAPAQFTRADMNRDGQLNAADILLLQKKLLQAALGIPERIAVSDVGQHRTVVQSSGNSLIADWLNALIPPAAALPANSGVLYYVHNDPLGTPQALTDESDALVWSASYDPYGQAAVNEDVDGDGNRVGLNVRLPGQYYDSETGLHYNGARYYDPSTGRYLTSDPIGIDGGLNTYLYASANPLRNIDPTGLVDWEGTQVSVGAAIGVGATFTRLNLSSKCVNGKKATATIWAVGPSIGIGAGATSPVTGSTNVAFEDNLSTPDPNVFNGIYSGYYIGVDYGPGRFGLEITVLGRAHAVGPAFSYGFGIAAGYIYTFGSSTAINSSVEDCCSQ
jgi:RHS repeat-associated protein